MWRYARPLSWLWWERNFKGILWPHNVLVPVWHSLASNPTNGLDELSPNIPWQHHIYPPAWDTWNNSTYIDNIPICRPTEWYVLMDGTDGHISRNSEICQFVWEHFQGLNQVVQQVKYSGSMFSRYKSVLGGFLTKLMWTRLSTGDPARIYQKFVHSSAL